MPSLHRFSCQDLDYVIHLWQKNILRAALPATRFSKITVFVQQYLCSYLNTLLLFCIFKKHKWLNTGKITTCVGYGKLNLTQLMHFVQKYTKSSGEAKESTFCLKWMLMELKPISSLSLCGEESQSQGRVWNSEAPSLRVLCRRGALGKGLKKIFPITFIFFCFIYLLEHKCLQYYVRFCCIGKWIRHMYTYIPSFWISFLFRSPQIIE